MSSSLAGKRERSLQHPRRGAMSRVLDNHQPVMTWSHGKAGAWPGSRLPRRVRLSLKPGPRRLFGFAVAI